MHLLCRREYRVGRRSGKTAHPQPLSGGERRSQPRPIRRHWDGQRLGIDRQTTRATGISRLSRVFGPSPLHPAAQLHSREKRLQAVTSRLQARTSELHRRTNDLQPSTSALQRRTSGLQLSVSRLHPRTSHLHPTFSRLHLSVKRLQTKTSRLQGAATEITSVFWPRHTR